MKNKIFLIALVIIALFIAAFLGFSIYYKNTKSNMPNTNLSAANNQALFQITPIDSSLLIKQHSISKGSHDAKVTIVEFLDPECEACSATYPFVKKIAQEFSNDVKLVIRYMPFHTNSKYTANILEGARAQGKFWEALELLFAEQDRWANHHNPNPDLIPEILAPLKLNMSKIITDAKNGKYDNLVLKDQSDGKLSGVKGTPTFFVNGHQLQELGYEPLRKAIMEALQKTD